MASWELRRLTGTFTDIDTRLFNQQQKEAAFQDQFIKRVRTIQTDNANSFKYSKKQKKLFHRTLSGLQVAVHKNQYSIWFTLTTKYVQRGFYDKEIHQRVVKCKEDLKFNERMKQNALELAETELNDHFQIWKKRVCRYVQKMLFDKWFFKQHPGTDTRTIEGRRLYRAERKKPYWGKGKVRPQYDKFEYKMTYLKVRTLEGGGVIHGFIRKDRNVPMLDQKVLSKFWAEVHHESTNISLEALEEKFRGEGMEQATNAALYICGTYFNTQPVVRQSSSYSWIFKGATKTWSQGKVVYGIKQYKTLDFKPSSYEEHFLIPELKIDRYKTRHFTEQIMEKNVLVVRESLLTLCMCSRNSNRKVTGYQQAIILWKKLIRSPPVGSRQNKLFLRKKRTKEQILASCPIEEMPLYLNPTYAEEIRINCL